MDLGDLQKQNSGLMKMTELSRAAQQMVEILIGASAADLHCEPIQRV